LNAIVLAAIILFRVTWFHDRNTNQWCGPDKIILGQIKINKFNNSFPYLHFLSRGWRGFRASIKKPYAHGTPQSFFWGTWSYAFLRSTKPV